MSLIPLGLVLWHVPVGGKIIHNAERRWLDPFKSFMQDGQSIGIIQKGIRLILGNEGMQFIINILPFFLVACIPAF
jgi:hypothetical protein